MKLGDEALFKQLFTLEWSDFQEMIGNYFLSLIGTTNQEVLEALTTKLDTSLDGDNMYQIYLNDTLIASRQDYFSEVNVYNILKFGSIKTYTPSLDG